MGKHHIAHITVAVVCSPPAQAFLLWDCPVAASVQEQYCESLPPVTNHTGERPASPATPRGPRWQRWLGGGLGGVSGLIRSCLDPFWGEMRCAEATLQPCAGSCSHFAR